MNGKNKKGRRRRKTSRKGKPRELLLIKMTDKAGAAKRKGQRQKKKNGLA